MVVQSHHLFPQENTPPGRHPPQEDTTTPGRHHPGAVHARRYRQQAGSMHPTGKHTCFMLKMHG